MPVFTFSQKSVKCNLKNYKEQIALLPVIRKVGIDPLLRLEFLLWNKRPEAESLMKELNFSPDNIRETMPNFVKFSEIDEKTNRDPQTASQMFLELEKTPTAQLISRPFEEWIPVIPMYKLKRRIVDALITAAKRFKSDKLLAMASVLLQKEQFGVGTGSGGNTPPGLQIRGIWPSTYGSVALWMDEVSVRAQLQYDLTHFQRAFEIGAQALESLKTPTGDLTPPECAEDLRKMAPEFKKKILDICRKCLERMGKPDEAKKFFEEAQKKQSIK